MSQKFITMSSGTQPLPRVQEDPRMRIDYVLNNSSCSSSKKASQSTSHLSYPTAYVSGHSLPLTSPRASKPLISGVNTEGITRYREPDSDVNFPPFEKVDGATLRRIASFGVRKMGHIRSSHKHIPYNSGKKDFQAKTGRECLEGIFSRTPLPPRPHTCLHSLQCFITTLSTLFQDFPSPLCGITVSVLCGSLHSSNTTIMPK